jgi:hypothetical protein
MPVSVTSSYLQIIAEQDLLPVGRFETIPVKIHGSGVSADYPNVCILRPVGNVDQLFQEAIKTAEVIGAGSLQNYHDHLDPRTSWDEVVGFLNHIGFIKGLYQHHSLRKPGTNELLDCVLPQTRKFFADLGEKVFRQQYAFANLGWKTKLHFDHDNCRLHGFRAMLPLGEPMYMGYEGERGENLIYRLNPGFLYFVNIGKWHRGFCLGPRLSMIFQLASDESILSAVKAGRVLAPLSDLSTLPQDVIQYERLTVSPMLKSNMNDI